MSFVLGTNKGKTATGDPLFIFTDAGGKTYLCALSRQNGVLVFRYYLKSVLTEITPVGGVYQGVPVGAGATNDLTVSSEVVNGLSGTGHPDGTELNWQSGAVSAYFPAITNLSWVPVSGAVDSITVATINATPGGNDPSKTKMFETVTANPDGTITVSNIKVGDKISIDGGTPVVATETSYTSPKLTDGSHKVIVTAVSTGTYYYDVAGTSVTTKIAFLSAPLDWFTENPILGVGVVIALLLVIVFVIVPLVKGEPVLGGMLDGKSSAKKVSKAPKRRFIA